MNDGITLSLSGKIAVIGGASQGIGWAIAQVFAEAGAKCILLARNEGTLKERVKQLENNSGISHEYLALDYGQPEGFKELLTPILSRYSVDILVNNTGGPAGGPLIKATNEALQNAFQQHVIANQSLAALIVPQMQSKGWGRIINIISTSVKVPLKGLGVSNTIRAAVGNWAKTLSNELASSGITVNNVLPGATSTGRLQEIIHNRSEQNELSENEVTNQMQSEIPIGRFATPQEVAYAALFIASNLADSINGINLPVDGGRTPSL